MSRRLLCGLIALCCLAGAAGPTRADFIINEDTKDYIYAQRRLCYRLDDEVAKNPYWVSWIENGVANWNKVKDQTGWQFRKCEPNEKADITIKFEEVPDESSTTRFETDLTCRIAIVKNISGRSFNGTTVSGGVDKTGWRLEGNTTLDPIKVVMHELTHCMRLSHGKRWSRGDFEEPIPPGDHNGRTPSGSDMTQTHKAASDGKPTANITLTLPPCFKDAAERAATKAKLENLIDQEKQKLEAADKAIHAGGTTSTQLTQLYGQAKQAVSNIEMLQDLLDKLPGICPPPTTQPPAPQETIAPTHSSRIKTHAAPVPSQNSRPTEEVAAGPHAGVAVGGSATQCPDWKTTKVNSLDSTDENKGDTDGCGSAGFRTSVYIGYDWALGARWLAGVEADLGYATNSKTLGVPGVSSAPGDSLSMREDWDGGLLARFGYAVAPNTIVYATGGLAWQHIQATVTCSSATPFPCGRFGPVTAMTASNDPTLLGWTLGGGTEIALAANLRLRLEYRYADYGAYSATYGNPANVAVTSDIRLRTNTAMVGLTYLFGGGGVATPPLVNK